ERGAEPAVELGPEVDHEEAAPRTHDAHELTYGAVRVGPVVHRQRRDRRIDTEGLERELRDVRNLDADPLAETLGTCGALRELDHRGLDVDACDLRVGPCSGNLDEQPSRAGPDVEHMPAVRDERR